MRCAWKYLATGESACSRPAAYRVYHDPCDTCAAVGHTTCQGADVCTVHTAHVRREDRTVARVVVIWRDAAAPAHADRGRAP